MTTFGSSSTTDDVLAGHDLTGKHVLVTGASTGLGEETARALSAHGAAVTLAVRDLVRGTAAADRIRSGVPEADLTLRELDLASLRSVRRFADGFLSDHGSVDVLINNAGVMACPFGTTVDGFELQFGTNHLGHFLLGTLLAPALVAGAPARLVSLSSSGHRFSDVDLEDWNFERTNYEPFIGYGRAKTANVLFAVGFQARYGAAGVQAYAVHPGAIRTELGRHMARDHRRHARARVVERPAVRVQDDPPGRRDHGLGRDGRGARRPRGYVPRGLPHRRADGRRIAQRRRAGLRIGPGAGRRALGPQRAPGGDRLTAADSRQHTAPSTPPTARRAGALSGSRRAR